MKKSVKLISILLSVLMIAAIFTSLPITANAEETNDVVDKAGFAVSAEGDGSADGFDLAEEIVSKLENLDKDQASVGAEAGESVGDNVASNMQIIRNYINSHYDTIDEEGKKVTVATEDNYGNEMKIYLILCDNDLISLSMHYFISDNVCVIADINEVDFSKSLKFFPHVTLWEGNTMHFWGKMSLNANTYIPTNSYTVNYSNTTEKYSDATIRNIVNIFTSVSINTYSKVLKKLMNISIANIGFSYYNNQVGVVPTSVSLNVSSVSISKGNTYKLYATVNPSTWTNRDIAWTTSNSSIATVSGGLVTAKAQGKVTITAMSYNGIIATCKVTVIIPPTSIKLNRSSVTMTAGTTYKVYATINPSNASDKTVFWSSSNPSIAGMASGGVIKAKKAGAATITAKTSNGKKATCKVTVNPVVPKSIKLNRSSVTMTAGTTYKLYATITPSNAKNKTVSWSSSKPSVAGMASGGVIKAKKAGTCTITAKTHNGKKVTCKVTVKSAVVPKSIKLNKSAVTITAGNAAKLYATITPSNATNKSVTWSSSNSSVASVSGGKITAKKAGSCNITAKTSNGKKATCKVTVKAKPKTVAVTGIKLNASSVTITAGKTYKLVATISPSNATNKKFTWYYSDSAVATVSGNGVVTAKKPGTCTITAKTPNGKKATCKVTVKAADKYVTNFNKLRTYINNHGKYDSDGYKYVDILGDSDTYLVLTNLPGGAIQYVCYEHIDEYRVLTTVTWNLNKSNICQFHTSVLNTFTSNIIYNVYANINVRSYNGSNATFSNNTDLARANLNMALDWLDIYTKHLIGVSVQNLGFINYY